MREKVIATKGSEADHRSLKENVRGGGNCFQEHHP
jgi:hypothetical protein